MLRAVDIIAAATLSIPTSSSMYRTAPIHPGGTRVRRKSSWKKQVGLCSPSAAREKVAWRT